MNDIWGDHTDVSAVTENTVYWCCVLQEVRKEVDVEMKMLKEKLAESARQSDSLKAFVMELQQHLAGSESDAQDYKAQVLLSDFVLHRCTSISQASICQFFDKSEEFSQTGIFLVLF